MNTSLPGATIPQDFLGLSFETGSLTSATGFPAENTQFLQMVSQLGLGWLRFGGNSVDKTAWARGQRTSASSSATLMSSDVDRVIAYARATGWRVLWGLNLKSSDANTAADEADYVQQNGGDVLAGFEIGNEPDLYSGITLVNFETNWKSFADAIQAINPKAILTGPADAGNISTWTGPFVNTEGSRLALVTQHFYPLGPPPTVPASQPNSASIPNLLSANTRGTADSAAQSLQTITAKPALPWRMAETNSCYNGGYEGVSNVFASALWGVDYMLTLAGHASAGLNFHGGGTGLYTPIATGTTGGVTTIAARPLYYAMLLFGAALGTRVVPVTVNSSRVNATAYGLLDAAGGLRVFVINKDSQFDAAVQITPGSAYTQATAIRLAAPSLTEKTAITLAGASVAADGTWTPQAPETVQGSGGTFNLTVPAGTAAVVGFGGTKLGIGNTAGGNTLVAPVSMASAYGTGLGFFARSTPTVSLPTTLAGVSATVVDAAGVSRAAPLIYVSPSQVNFQVPDGTAPGTATVTLGGASGTVQVAPVAPGLFTLGATTVAAATAERYSLGGTDLGPVPVFDCSSGTCTPAPIALDSQSNVFLTLYGTGIRGETNLANVSATIGGVSVPVQYAGAQGQYPGFDQVNVQLPGQLHGAGTVNVVLGIDGQASNSVQIAVK
ncbi:MAG: glycosyl hydrolase family protein [Candidatus Sulfopaludibacter sp.]|nr:glycosyl hydrolase family protein [Candidatus Sulfopaludibacter sp.]